MKWIVAALIIFFSFFNSGMLFAKKENSQPLPLRVVSLNGAAPTSQPADTVTESTYIHYTGKYCTECHDKKSEKGAHTVLRFGGDFTRLCWCHGYTAGTYIHPVDVAPSDEKKIPRNFPLRDGKISCNTCHDIYMQCQERRMDKYLRKRMMFLRGALFRKRTDICFKCHDEKLTCVTCHNPHEKGVIPAEKAGARGAGEKYRHRLPEDMRKECHGM